MIKFHPPLDVLEQYVRGDLNAALGVVVATHVDMCRHCQQQVAALEEELSEALFNEELPVADAQLDAMLANIMEQPAAPAEHMGGQPLTGSRHSVLQLDGQEFRLPRPLARMKNKIGPWSRMPGNLMRAPLDLGTDEKVNLIYMQRGSSLPEHTHKGQEATLVVNGTFRDEFASYHDGDFMLLDSEQHHSPQTAEEDCLTLAFLDAPLHFTSGVSRLLNPFSSLFFR